MTVLYDHAYCIGFALRCTDPTGVDGVTAHMLRRAILKRLAMLDDDELLEAVGAPFDTFEVDPPDTRSETPA